jgi:hypothetical protein
MNEVTEEQRKENRVALKLFIEQSIKDTDSYLFDKTSCESYSQEGENTAYKKVKEWLKNHPI